MIAWLGEALSAIFSLEQPKCPKQLNGDDCGVYLIAFIARVIQQIKAYSGPLLLSFNMDFDVKPAQFRRDMKELILG